MSIMDRIWRSSIVQWTIFTAAFIAALFSKDKKENQQR